MTELYDSNHQLICACDDLRAVRTIVSMAEEHGEEKEVLSVVRRVLDPIIDDIQDSIETIDEALIRLRKEQVLEPGGGEASCSAGMI